MKNILNETDRNQIFQRVESLNETDAAQWGKMNAAQMVCHAADQVRLAMGIKTSLFFGNILTRTILKQLILLGMPAPKGKVETVKELKQGAGGTNPSIFNNDKKELIELIDNFSSRYPAGLDPVHPAFGRMDKNQWGRLAYIHLDYHLKQFAR